MLQTIKLVPNMIYKGIAYEMKQLVQRGLLVGEFLVKLVYQDANIAWYPTGGSITP